MTDRFTTLITQQLQQLFQRLGGGVERSGQRFDSSFNSASPVTLSPQQIVEVMEGNSQWLEAFESAIEQRFSQLSQKILTEWEQETERAMQQSLERFAQQTQALFASQPSGAAANNTGGFAQVAGRNIGSQLQGIVRRTANEFIEDLFTQTRIRVQETDRSQEEVQRFTASRGQVQAELSAELARGKRYQ